MSYGPSYLHASKPAGFAFLVLLHHGQETDHIGGKDRARRRVVILSADQLKSLIRL